MRADVSVCLTVAPETGPNSEIGVMTIAAGKYAVTASVLDPSEHGQAWTGLMCGWLPSSGYQPDGRCFFELCLNDPERRSEKQVVEIWQSVNRLQGTGCHSARSARRRAAFSHIVRSMPDPG